MAANEAKGVAAAEAARTVADEADRVAAAQAARVTTEEAKGVVAAESARTAAEEAHRAAMIEDAHRAVAAETERLIAAGQAAAARIAAAAAAADAYAVAAAQRSAEEAKSVGAAHLEVIEPAALETAIVGSINHGHIRLEVSPPVSPASSDSKSSTSSCEPCDEAGWTAQALIAAATAAACEGRTFAELGHVPSGVRLNLSPKLASELVEAVPRALRLRKWTLAFSTEVDGYSLQSLLRKVEGRSESVLLLRDSGGAVFGAFISQPWRSGPRYFGTGETFLFSTRRSEGEEPQLRTFRWTRANDHFVHVDCGGLAFGSPECGLAIDASLEAGSSRISRTYGNDPLASANDFTCVRLEVWALSR
eukprot:scaffold213812_cov19-Tisochrysis_lutea.AAC.1